MCMLQILKQARKSPYKNFNTIITTRKYGATNSTKPPFLKALQSGYGEKTAIRDRYGIHSYHELIKNSMILSERILALADCHGKIKNNSKLLCNERISFLSSNCVTYTIMQWAIWLSGGVAVPLAKSHPESELEYVIKDSDSFLLLSNQELSDRIFSVQKQNQHLQSIVVEDDSYFYNKKETFGNSCKFVPTEPNPEVSAFNHDINNLSLWESTDWSERNAMLIYTSGTTGKPKGVVTTFESLNNQLDIICNAWSISETDTTLHVLPLHHIHGVVNALACSLWSGGTCLMMPYFNSEQVWTHLLETDDVSVFHAVPTVYAMLIEYYEKSFLSVKKKEIKEVLSRKMRLMVSGSAALPEPIANRWLEISGHSLLERYGMTEIGMALTNSLYGKRITGAVGTPFPTVKIQIKSNGGQVLVEGDHQQIVTTDESKDTLGHLLIKGPSVFKEYWNRPEATEESFTDDGWFLTGDTALYDVEQNTIRIMGRTSVDIIKYGGYKISALDIERHLLSHPNIAEVAVVGVPDEMWGQLVCAILVVKSNSSPLTLKELQLWASHIMPNYHIPKKLVITDAIPRNVMGKVNKKQLVKDMHLEHS